MAVRRIRGLRLRPAGRGRALALLVALYGAAAVVATLPAVGSFGSSFIADGGDGHGEAAAGDHLQATYRFWLVGHQLERGAAPWLDPYSFQPLVEPQVVLSGWPFGLAFWPLDAAFGPVVAWNLLLLTTIVAAGLLTYGWLRMLALPPGAAAIGGLVFAVAPYRLAQSGVHLLAWIAILMPLALLAYERARAAETTRRAHAWGAVSAAAVVSIPLSGQLHLALGAIPLIAVYVAVRAAPLAAAWAAGGLLAAVGVGLAVHLTIVRDSAEEDGRSLAEVGEFSADWVDLISRWRLGGLEQFVYVGWLVPVLAVAGIVVLWERSRALASLLGAAAVLPSLLALGTNLPLYEWLWDVFPPLRYPRVPGRLVPVANLAVAALVAVAAARIAVASGRRAAAATAAVLVLVAADLLVFPLGDATVADPGNRAYAALRDEPEGRVLELPLIEPGVHYGSVYDYYQLQAPREGPAGYSTLVPQPAFDFYFLHNRISCGVWLPGDEEELDELGIRFVTFHEGVYAQAEVPGAWFGWRELVARGYTPLASGGVITLLGHGTGSAEPPVPEPPRADPLYCEGWKGRTMKERQAPFWLYGSGSVQLEVSAPDPTPATLWVDGVRVDRTTVSREATLNAELEGEGWHALVLEVPRLLDTTPPQGLRLERLGLDLFPGR